MLFLWRVGFFPLSKCRLTNLRQKLWSFFPYWSSAFDICALFLWFRWRRWFFTFAFLFILILLIFFIFAIFLAFFIFFLFLNLMLVTFRFLFWFFNLFTGFILVDMLDADYLNAIWFITINIDIIHLFFFTLRLFRAVKGWLWHRRWRLLILAKFLYQFDWFLILGITANNKLNDLIWYNLGNLGGVNDLLPRRLSYSLLLRFLFSPISPLFLTSLVDVNDLNRRRGKLQMQMLKLGLHCQNEEIVLILYNFIFMI